MREGVLEDRGLEGHHGLDISPTNFFSVFDQKKTLSASSKLLNYMAGLNIETLLIY